MKQTFTSLIGLLSLSVPLMALQACGKSEAPPAPAASAVAAPPSAPASSASQLRVVDAVTAVPLAQADTITMNGVLAFREEMRAAFKTGGVIARVAVREGDVVKAGEVLAALDVSEIDAGLAQAQALYDKAIRDLKRGETLRKKEVIPQETLDNLRTAEAAAAASLKAARFNRGTAELRASETVVVLKRVAEPGEVVGAGQPVLLLGSMKSGLVFRGGLNDAQRVRLNSDGKAQVQLDAWPGESFDADVREMGQAADARTGAYRVELGIKSTAGKTLLAGMVGRARIPARVDSKASWVLPLSAVVESAGAEVSVFRLQDGDVVSLQKLALVQLRRDTVVVTGDIAADMRFVSSGTSYLSDGTAVRVNDSQRSKAP